MKRAFFENTEGLWDTAPHRDAEIVFGKKKRKTKDYSCFYEIRPENKAPLWSRAVSDKRPYAEAHKK